MRVSSTYTIEVNEVPPRVTEAPATKLVPVIVTVVPAGDGPEFGTMLETPAAPGGEVGVRLGVRVGVRVGVCDGVVDALAVGVRVKVRVGVRVAV
jgi:hypothetical protein